MRRPTSGVIYLVAVAEQQARLRVDLGHLGEGIASTKIKIRKSICSVTPIGSKYNSCQRLRG